MYTSLQNYTPKTSFTSIFLFTFPIAFRGISSRTLISCGILYAASRSRSARRMSIAPHGFPGLDDAAAASTTTTAATFWPHCSLGRPRTAASVIWGLGC